MNERVDQFDQFVLHLREVFFALRGISERLLREFDCSASERSLLQELETLGSQTVPDLAQARAVSRQAMQKSVDGLLARGWLSVEENPRHARSSLVAIAPDGSRAFAKMRALEVELIASLALPVRPAELKRTTESLALLGKFLGTVDIESRRSRRKGGAR